MAVVQSSFNWKRETHSNYARKRKISTGSWLKPLRTAKKPKEKRVWQRKHEGKEENSFTLRDVGTKGGYDVPGAQIKASLCEIKPR